MYPTSLVFMAYYTLDRHLDDPHQFTRDHQFLSKIKTYNMVAIFCSICLDFNIEYGLAFGDGQGLPPFAILIFKHLPQIMNYEF